MKDSLSSTRAVSRQPRSQNKRSTSCFQTSWIGLNLSHQHLTPTPINTSQHIFVLIPEMPKVHEVVGIHYDNIKWKHFLCYWPFVRGINRSPVNSLHKGQWHCALMFSFICIWINGGVNNDEAGDLRRHRAHYDVNVMVGVADIILSSNRQRMILIYRVRLLCMLPGVPAFFVGIDWSIDTFLSDYMTFRHRENFSCFTGPKINFLQLFPILNIVIYKEVLLVLPYFSLVLPLFHQSRTKDWQVSQSLRATLQENFFRSFCDWCWCTQSQVC